MHIHKSITYKNFSGIFSTQTLDYHHGKHHKIYVNKLNSLIIGTQYENLNLEETIRRSYKTDTAIYNNSAQVWNHDFYWESLSNKSSKPAQIMTLIADKYGDLERFQQQFIEAAMSVFGSGWIWLVADKNDELSIAKYSNADNPLITGKRALLAIDVWEHAYYIEYYNSRLVYLQKIMKHLNWELAENNFNESKDLKKACQYTIYTRENCPYCDQAKILLKIKGYSFFEINVSQNPGELQEMLDKSNGKRTFPQVFRGNQHIGGCDDLQSYLRKK